MYSPSTEVSPAISSGSYVLVDTIADLSAEDYDSDNDGNDIVLSPSWSRMSHRITDSAELATEDELNDRDFVLILPGSSALANHQPAPNLSTTPSLPISCAASDHSTSYGGSSSVNRLAEDLEHLHVAPPPESVYNSSVIYEDTPRSGTPAHISYPVPSPQTSSETRGNAAAANPPRIGTGSPLTKSQKRARARRRAKARKEKRARKAEGNRAATACNALATGPIAPKTSSKAAKKSLGPLDEVSNDRYDEAVEHMNTFLSVHKAKLSTHERFTTAKALLVELGITTTIDSIPKSLTAARALFTSLVHINILDYLILRGKPDSPKKLRAALFPSKKALKADVRKRRASLDMVKAAGLRDLLVDMSH